MSPDPFINVRNTHGLLRHIQSHHPDGDPASTERFTFSYEDPKAAEGRFIHTYEGDGSPLPSFEGEPIEIDMPEPEDVWAALNADNKVSLYTNVRGEVKIFNKNLGD